MEHIYASLVPVFGLIMLGYFFKRISFPSHEFWPLADKLTYFVLMPTLLVFKLSTSHFNFSNLGFIFAPILAILFTTILLVIFNLFWRTSPSAFTSIVQGGIRFNAYMFIALSGAIFGDDGLILGAIVVAFCIPSINIICVTIFAAFTPTKRLSFAYVIGLVLKNPLILACGVGIAINSLQIPLYVSVLNLLEILSKTALPLGLMSVGYALVLKQITSAKKDILVSCVAKFILLPLLVFATCRVFELSQIMTSLLLLFSLLPTAPSSFILARQLGGDVPLITSIITLQTLLSAVSIVIFLNFYM